MSAPLTPAERHLAPMLAAWDAWKGNGGDDAATALRDFGELLKKWRLAAFDGLRCDLTDAGRDLVARWQAERERDIDVHARAAYAAFTGANDGDRSWERLTTGAQSVWRDVVRAVDASRDGAP